MSMPILHAPKQAIVGPMLPDSHTCVQSTRAVAISASHMAPARLWNAPGFHLQLEIAGLSSMSINAPKKSGNKCFRILVFFRLSLIA